MLTNQLLSYYNHLLAASIMYLTVVEPLKDIANTLSGHMEGENQNRLGNLVLAEASQDQDYYKTLGVEKDATKQEVHRAFRQLAKKYHPDKNKDKGATEEFIKIFKAYETLSDEKKRKEYDQQKDSAHAHSSWTTTTSSMNDFDINDFFKQYEDQFMRHAQHHQHSYDHNQDQHHHQHYEQHHKQHQQDHFNFHGINLDDLFSNIDDDEFSSFGKWFDASSHNHNHFHHQAMDGHFGDGASYFGSHFAAPVQDSLLNQYHQLHSQYNNHHQQYQQQQAAHSYSCQTVTRQVNGMTMTQTSCA